MWPRSRKNRVVFVTVVALDYSLYIVVYNIGENYKCSISVGAVVTVQSSCYFLQHRFILCFSLIIVFVDAVITVRIVSVTETQTMFTKVPTPRLFKVKCITVGPLFPPYCFRCAVKCTGVRMSQVNVKYEEIQYL